MKKKKEKVPLENVPGRAGTDWSLGGGGCFRAAGCAGGTVAAGALTTLQKSRLIIKGKQKQKAVTSKNYLP